VKLAALVAVPPDGSDTLMGPVVAPDGTVAVILLVLLKVDVAETPLKLTEVAPVKLAPEIATLVPTGPLVGVKLVIRSATRKVNGAVVAVPAGFVTLIGPVVALAGTVAVICVFESTPYVAATPLNLTAVVPEKLTPVMTTLAPTPPLPGENP
jgi:hypothetical protein